MATLLTEKQFEILPVDGSNHGVVFGLGRPVEVTASGFKPGTGDILNQDSVNKRRGTISFGRDIKGPAEWSFSGFSNHDEEIDALESVEDLAAAWNPIDTFDTAGRVSVLRYTTAGRTRRVFGRPRRFEAAPDNVIMSGMIPVDMTFQCVDSYSYDDIEQMSVIDLTSDNSTGGFVFPVTFPVSTLTTNNAGDDQVDVGGRVRTYPRITIRGPIVNPVLTSDDWTIRLNGTIPQFGYVVIDCRPWVLAITDHRGANASSMLDSRSWLEDCYLRPNYRNNFNLSGATSGGVARAEIRWRNAYNLF